jgi:hypothetical protein
MISGLRKVLVVQWRVIGLRVSIAAAAMIRMTRVTRLGEKYSHTRAMCKLDVMT